MIKTKNSRQYTIGGIRFKANFLCPFFRFDTEGGSFYFQEDKTDCEHEWTLNYNASHTTNAINWETIFHGSESFDVDLPYKWSVVRIDKADAIYVEFEDDPNIINALATIDIKNNQVNIDLTIRNNQPFSFDPFIHPLGILVLQYLVYLYGGFVIHASTVSYRNKGFLFSAVSGTGKSTMANIWKQYGATIINDDRLIILPHKDGFKAYNTPMQYYKDKSKEVVLHKVFLINQSPNNYIKQLPVLKGALGMLGNCMQFQYDEHQINSRLEALIKISEGCGVYECGFKPDKEIVELILKELA